MAQKRGYRNGGNRKLARAEKRKRYYQRHPDKSPEAKRRVEGKV